MVFKYLGRKYNIEAAWTLIERGHAELVELTEPQVQAIKRLPRPPERTLNLLEESDEPLVIVRDAIPSGDGPPEVVAVLIDGWNRFIEKASLEVVEPIYAWVIEDTDLVEEQVVEE